MQKIKFMAMEFLRSFQKSLFKNLLLMAMFSISIVMSVIMCSYYFDFGERHMELIRHIGDSAWHELSLNADEGKIFDNLTSAAGCQNLMDYYGEIASSEEYPFMAINPWQGVVVREGDMKRLLGGESYLGFLQEGEQAGSGYFQEGEVCSVINIKGAQVDLNAYRYLGLRVGEGEGFNEQNMVIAQPSDPVPILLGASYQGAVKPGAELDVSYWGYVYPCRVVGILEKGAELPPCGVGDTTPLDPCVLFPYGVKVANASPDAKEMEKYAVNDYASLDNGFVQVMEEGGLGQVVAFFREAGKKYSLPAIRVIGTSMGMELLRKESASSIRVMSILSAVLLCFSLYGLMVTFYDKVQSNRRVYGIYLMNGCPVWMVLLPSLAEVAVIILPAVFVGRYVFTMENVGYFRIGAILRVVYGFAGLAFLAGAGFLGFLVRGVDTEHLIRQKE